MTAFLSATSSEPWCLWELALGDNNWDGLVIFLRLASLSYRKIKVIFCHCHQSVDCTDSDMAMWMTKWEKGTPMSHTALYQGNKRSFNIYENHYCRLCLWGTAWTVFRNWEWKVKMTNVPQTYECMSVVQSPLYIPWRNCFLNPPTLKIQCQWSLWVSEYPFFLSFVCSDEHFVEMKHWTRSVWDASTCSLIGTRNIILWVNCADNTSCCWYYIYRNDIFVQIKSIRRLYLNEMQQWEFAVKTLFWCSVAEKAAQLSTWVLHERNLGGQGSGKILTDTRTLMYPRPLKQMTQILTESSNLADSALQM